MKFKLLSTLALMGLSVAAAQNRYAVKNLVSDVPGLAAQTDKNLKNPWGLAASGTSPFWVSNNHTGTTTLYNSDGLPFPSTGPLVVTIPPSAGGTAPSSPTGQVVNDLGGFEVQPGKSAAFLFATEDGTISAWNQQVDVANARTVVDNSSSGAVYKGIAIAATPAGNQLYVCNFNSGAVEIYDNAFNPVALSGELTSALIPGYAPFNIQRIGRTLLVTYAKQNDDHHDDVAGPGNGYVYQFSLDGHLLAKLISGGALNSPWGIVLAPEFFGDFSNALLIGNFGDGTINAYEPCSGAWLGTLANPGGSPLSIPGLWALRFGNGHNGGESGVLYFTAGIPGDGNLEDHGLFGSIRVAPVPAPPPAAPPANVTVDIRNFTFIPDPINVSVGGKVIWTNADGAAHTVRGDNSSFSSPTLSQKSTFTQQFDTPGTFTYHCSIHPFMTGKVVVQ